MRVLLIGGTGNISASCAAELHRGGHRVGVVGRGNKPVPAQYVGLRADRKDLAGMQAVTRQFEPEVVLNFLGYDLGDVQLDYEVFRARVQQYIFISSASVYIKPAPRLPITEDSPVGNAWWEYAQKKIACEQWLLERVRENRFPATIVRPSHTYSELWVPNPVSSSSYTFCVRLEQAKPVFVPDNGDNPWTMTAASDFACGLAGLVGCGASIGEAFHITSEEVMTWNSIVGEIAAALGVDDPKVVRVPTEFICRAAPQMTGTLKGDKAHPGIFDNSKIKRFVPGFLCRKPFRVGVRESVAWLRAHPGAQNLNPAVEALCEKVIGEWERSGTTRAAG